MNNQYNYYRPDDNEDNQNNQTYYNNQNQYGYQNQYNYQYQEPEKKTKQKKKIPKLVKNLFLALLLGSVGGSAFAGTNYLVSNLLEPDKKEEKTTSVSSTQLTTSNSSVTSDVSQIVDNTMPSIVSITNMSVQQVQNFFGGVREYESESAGSGFIIAQTDTELLIVSNNHVVEGSKTLTVTFHDESSVEALIKGTDAARDLAVIAVPLDNIDNKTLSTIKIATLGDSNTLKVGEPTIAIGNALGYGQSVTSGIVSANQRSIEGFDGVYIQTDAAINPGNSGGALLNINGEVIGINSAKIASSSVEGMGFAIPISEAMDIIQPLMNRETRSKVPEAERGYIGIQGYDVSAESAKMYNMPVGVYIAEVVDGGGAQKAGLSKGMILTKFEGITVTDMDSLKEQLTYYRYGEKVEITVQVPANGVEYEEQVFTVELQQNK